MMAFRAAKRPFEISVRLGRPDIKNDVVDYLIWCVDAKSGWIAAAQIGDRIPSSSRRASPLSEGTTDFITYIIQFLRF